MNIIKRREEFHPFGVLHTDADFQNAIKRIDKIINEGFEKDEENRKEFLEIALAIQLYEKQYYPLRWPESISEMIELKMFEMKIPNQKKLADKLKLAPDKLSPQSHLGECTISKNDKFNY